MLWYLRLLWFLRLLLRLAPHHLAEPLLGSASTMSTLRGTWWPARCSRARAIRHAAGRKLPAKARRVARATMAGHLPA